MARIRGFFGSLTLRGRAFLAAGLTAIVCAALFGQPALIRIGALVLVLPVVAAAFTALRRPELEVARTILPRLARAGEGVQVEVVVRQRSGRALGSLLVEDALPYTLGGRPRFVLRDLRGEWRRQLRYTVRSDVRGKYPVGPLAVRVTDPFGLVEASRTTAGTAELTVTPRILPLPPITVGGGWQGAGDHRPQAFATGSAEDVGVREYRRGDELRRVHWPSSARLGELMVRREEQPWEAHATVLLDNRKDAHRGHGLASSLEAAVLTAASIVVHLEQHGFTVRLVTADGTVDGGTAAALERLAVIGLSERSRLDAAAARYSAEQARGGVVVAVLGDTDDSQALRRIRHDAGIALAVVLDVEQWSRTTTSGPSIQHLTALSWRVATAGPRDRLDAVWRDLGSAPASTQAGVRR